MSICSLSPKRIQEIFSSLSLCICALCVYSEEGDRKNMKSTLLYSASLALNSRSSMSAGITLPTPAYLHPPKYTNWMDFCLVCTVQKNLNRRSPANVRSPFSVDRLLSLTHTFPCVGSDEKDDDLYFCGPY